MTGQWEPEPKPYEPPKRRYLDWQVDEHDAHPIWHHGGHVPGTRRAHHVARDTGQEKR